MSGYGQRVLAGEILVLVISAAAVAAGLMYVRTGRRMRAFHTTRGTVVGREIGALADSGEGRWGNGGGHYPKVTYEYSVDGVTYTSNRWRYTTAGYKRSVAQQMLDECPDEVDVHYDPAKPQEAYLQTNTPRWGYVMAGFGIVGVLVAAALIFG